MSVGLFDGKVPYISFNQYGMTIHDKDFVREVILRLLRGERNKRKVCILGSLREWISVYRELR